MAYDDHGCPLCRHNVKFVFIGYLSIPEDVAVKSIFLDAMRRLTIGIEGQYFQVVAKFQTFKECIGAFANIPLAMKANILPHKWWDLVGGGGTYLAHLGECILPQVCSSSSCKGN